MSKKRKPKPVPTAIVEDEEYEWDVNFAHQYKIDFDEGVAEGRRIADNVARMMTPPRRVHMPPDERNKSDGYRGGVESVLGNVKWPSER